MIMPPPLSWIFTKYANEWPPRKKDPEVVNTKKEPEVITTKKEPEVVNTKKEPEVITTKKEPEVAFDLWLLILTRKRPTLTIP